MLKVPTDAPRDLDHMFDYQLTVLNFIRLDDEEMETESTQVPITTVFITLAELEYQTNIDALEWVRHSNPTAAPNLICVYMGPKYEVPSNGKSSSAPKERGTLLRRLGESWLQPCRHLIQRLLLLLFMRKKGMCLPRHVPTWWW